MMGNTHAITGVLAAVIAAQVIDASWGDIATGAVLVVGAAMVPDIDHENSTVTKTLGPLTRGLSWVVRTVTGGHRRGTHSVLGAAALAGAVQLCLDHRGEWWSIVVLSVVLFLCLAGPLRLLKINGWLDDLLPIPVAIVAAWRPEVPLALAPHMIMIGVLVHILGDMITKQGCPVLWPLKSKRYRLARFKAGGPAERWFFRPAFVVAIPVAACWEWINPWWLMGLEAAQKYLAG